MSTDPILDAQPVQVSRSNWARRELSAAVIGWDRVDEIRALLHRVYHDELGWSPPAENPSRQMISRLSSGEVGFVDRYDQSCLWIALLHKGKIVGCMRLIGRVENDSALELENYFTLPEPIVNADLFEVNRLAVAAEFRGGRGNLMLLEQALAIAHRTNRALITAATRVTARYSRLYGGMKDTGLRFFYHRDDPEEVAVLVLENRDRAIERQLQLIRKRLTTL